MTRSVPQKVTVHDKMQSGYTYELTAPEGRDFHPDFRPDLTPAEMLELGVFGGKYMTDCCDEFPASWFTNAKLAPQDENSATHYDKKLNFFGVRASQSLAEWQRKGWINDEHDPRGWFQWYCRYYRGRRLPEEDLRQIKRWKAIARHIAQIAQNCRAGDVFCRPVQRQAVLHWAYDSRKL